jgi:hypothetical protein
MLAKALSLGGGVIYVPLSRAVRRRGDPRRSDQMQSDAAIAQQLRTDEELERQHGASPLQTHALETSCMQHFVR